MMKDIKANNGSMDLGPTKRKSTFRFVFFMIALFTVCIFLNIQCGKGPIAFAREWSPHSFLLTEHPEVFANEGVKFENIKKQLTFDGDTCKGFAMWVANRLAFNVSLPLNGSLRFVYGIGNDSLNKGVIRLTATTHGELGQVELGSWELDTTDKDQLASWHSVNVPISADAAGTERLTFEITDAEGGERPGPLFLGHPTIVQPNDAGKRTRVIWISLDTLRADHMGCYGYERDTTPVIDAFAEEGAIFERCISSCPWTFPSYAAMFTGLYPSISGAKTSVRFLPTGATTLAEILSAKDMPTFALVNVPWASETAGLHRGFDRMKRFTGETADVSFAVAREWLNEHSDEDIFLFVHLYDPHLPYRPKVEFLGRFDPGYEGRYKEEFKNFDAVRNNITTLNDREKEHIIALYDEGILGCDKDVGDFFGFLKENDFYDDSMIIINADHGEEFWEHGGFEHGATHYDEVLHVPMIIRGPGFELGKRYSEMCGVIDVFPTILEWLGITPPDEINAISLNKMMRGLIEPEKRMLLSEQLYFGTEQKGVSTDQYRYILHTIDRAEELYDVPEDPAMQANVVDDRRATARNFRYFLTEYTLNEGLGWHVRIYRTGAGERLGEVYEGKIVAPSGFAEVIETKLADADIFEIEGNEIRFKIKIANWANKAFDFRTNDENDIIVFEIITDGSPDADQLTFIGPEREPAPSTTFTMSILDPIFGLGMPQFGPQGPMHHGFYLWGNSETLHEEVSPELDDRTLEELKSLGYLQG